MMRWPPGIDVEHERAKARAMELVDDRLFDAYWVAVEHFGTTDLVLHFDTNRDVDPVDAYVRARFVERFVEDVVNKGAGKDVVGFFSRLNKPAKDSANLLKDASTAFWLVAEFPDAMIITAVVATRMGAEGVS